MWAWLKSNHQSLTALTAIVLSVVALFVAWDQSRVMRAQQHGALIPIVELGQTLSNDEEGVSFELMVRNEGVGPAFVEHVSLRRDGVPVLSANELIASLPPGAGRSWGSSNGLTLGVGEDVMLLTLSWEAGQVDTAAFYQMIEALQSWQFDVCYCSVFGRCWESTLGAMRAERVAVCRPGDIDPFGTIGSGVTRE
jgi:hypothetical protein